MDRHSKITSISLPPQLYEALEQAAAQTGQNRSTLLQEIIRASLSTRKNGGAETTLEPTDLASVLKAYWSLRSETTQPVTIVGLVIMTNDEGEVLIASRKQADTAVPNLTWSFPGSRLHSLDFHAELMRALDVRTKLIVDVRNLITTRLVPESGANGTQVVALYFQGQMHGKQLGKAFPPYDELKWVKPLDVFKYFTSSTNDDVARYLSTLQSG
jgi:hypothetical protein